MTPEEISPEQAQAIVQCRERKLSPKEIARQMGLRPAVISEFLRSYNAEVQPARQPAELAPLVSCWINQGAVAPLLKGKGDGTGMAQIIVARMEKQRYTIGQGCPIQKDRSGKI
jgi:predicted transcriptional regulator